MQFTQLSVPNGVGGIFGAFGVQPGEKIGVGFQDFVGWKDELGDVSA
jgi:hypothetical protein